VGPGDAMSVLESLLVAAGIGFGAPTQALLGTYLIRRFVNLESELVGQPQCSRAGH
jgi:hypothetical protein